VGSQSSSAHAAPIAGPVHSAAPARSTTSGRAAEFVSEPNLHEMLNDPVIRAVMARDGVDRQDILDQVASVRLRLGL
jgi:hypothetical protein